MKPANFLDSHEKFLLGVATKGGNLFFLKEKGQKCLKLVHVWLELTWFMFFMCTLEFQLSSYLML